MSPEEISDHRTAPMTRRTVVRRGAKIAYAAPVVAASFKLCAKGASAQAAVSPGKFSCCRCVDGLCFNGLTRAECEGNSQGQFCGAHGGIAEFTENARCGPGGVCVDP